MGPGDIVGAHRESLLRGAAATTSLAFSEQLFNYCKAVATPLLAISSHPRADTVQDGPIQAENRQKSNRQSPHSGLGFHLLQLRYALYLAYRARRFRADVAFIDSSTSHYFALSIFRLIGIPVVVNLHNVLWPQGFPPTGLSGRVVRWLNAQFFRWFAAGAIGVSPECERQVLSEARQRIPFFQYRCQFNRDGFFVAPGYQGGPFQVAFVGRAEVSKGVLDLVEISEILATKCSTPIIFHVCGEGPALALLRDMIRRKGLESRIITHGHLKREELLKLYSSCHAVIVPTTGAFPEGMPQVCAEAVITRLPIVASRVTNALDVLGPAIAEAETNNRDSYAEQLGRLATDSSRYEQLRSATDALSGQFFDRSFSYPAAVDRMLSKLFRDRRHINDWSSVFLSKQFP
ncbi:glycosyltransferase family 4 protein [Bradyrhizobium roseum]|uniref:glycosyltransferase family 4 protein n=1 Tax=Bradyrhizobium roseum TaxID=3056648 RepID=UPI0026390526|nr:glycosyltransferase [Bradyrhizobium roseus]WKA30625.1 glycosyltransferase [Bradyrhizobium roseus]